MKKVMVVMSTYNGSKNLTEQVNSIFSQIDVEVKLYVRDDKSTDDTRKILLELQKKYKERLIVEFGEYNLGFLESFVEALRKARNEPRVDYFAFSDQDDFWMEDKLKSAVVLLEKRKSEFKLYYSAMSETNENLDVISQVTFEKSPNLFGAAMSRSRIAGCTIVINNNLAKIVMPTNGKLIGSHDTWMYRVSLAIGADVVYDNRSHIKYRRHVGAVTQGQNRMLIRLKREFSKKGAYQARSKVAKLIFNNYGNLITNENRKLIVAMTKYDRSYKAKMQLIFAKNLTYNNVGTDMLIRLKVLTNRF